MEIGRVKNSPTCVRIYIFNFKEQRTNKQTKKTRIKKTQKKLKKKREDLPKID